MLQNILYQQLVNCDRVQGDQQTIISTDIKSYVWFGLSYYLHKYTYDAVLVLFS